MTEKIIYEPSETTHYKNLYSQKNQLLGSHNFNPEEELVGIIAKQPTLETIKNHKGGDLEIAVIEFTNKIKMTLNISNARVIAGLYGDLQEHWIGKPIQVYVGQVKNPSGRGTVAGLKIRERIPDTGEDAEKYETPLKEAKTKEELVKAWMNTPPHLQPRLTMLKDEMKGKLK